MYTYIYILYTVCRYTVYVCIHVIQIILLYRHARPLVIPLGHISIWQYVPVHSCLYDYIPWLCGNFGGEHLPQKALLGIDHFAQDGKNHAVVLLYKWATGQWFQCTFHYISFRWANRMVWMFNLQWFGHILELNQTLLDVKTPLHFISIHPSGVVFAGTWFERACRPLWAVAPEAGGREQDETVYELDEVSHVFGAWHGLALHCPPLNVYMSLVHIYSKHWLKNSRCHYVLGKSCMFWLENEWPYKTYESWAKGPWKGFPLRKPLGMQLTVSAKVFFWNGESKFFSG